MLSRERYESLPPGGYQGELATPAVSTPAPPPPVPFTIPPPEWSGREADTALAAPAEPVPSDTRLDALAEMKGFDPPEPDLRPPEVLEPLERFVPPKVDWREEERERVARERAERAARQLSGQIEREGR
jgi:hypothetical protein